MEEGPTAYCSKVKKIIREKYVELTRLPIESILGDLFAKEVITLQQKGMIQSLTSNRQKMEYLLDNIIIPSLDINIAEKLKGFMEVMEKSDDLILTEMSKKLVTGSMVVELADSEVNKKFRDFVVMKLQQKYSRVVRKLIHIFKEKKVDIEELITVLCFHHVDKKSVFSTDDAFSTIKTENQLFRNVARYCKGIYDYKVLDVVVQASECPEAIKELTDFTESLRNSVLTEIDLMSDHGELLHPDDFMSGTYKFIIEYVGGKCTIETKEMVQNIVEQSVRFTKGVLIFKGIDPKCILFIYQVSKAAKDYLLEYNFTDEDIAFLNENKITSLIVDGVMIMSSSQPNKTSKKFEWMERGYQANKSVPAYQSELALPYESELDLPHQSVPVHQSVPASQSEVVMPCRSKHELPHQSVPGYKSVSGYKSVPTGRSQQTLPYQPLTVSPSGIYSLDKIPSESSNVVREEKGKVLKEINLRSLVTNLGRVGDLIQIAYNSVSAAGYQITKEQIEIQLLEYDITKLCDKSALTVAKFKKASSSILNDLQCTYGYLLDNLEEMALETLSSVSKLAGQMEKAALELRDDFLAEEKKVITALENTQIAKKIRASKVEEEKKKRIQLEENVKHEQELIKDYQEKERKAEAGHRGIEQEEDKATYEIGVPNFEMLVNAFTTKHLKVKIFDEDDAKKKAEKFQQSHLDALEAEEAIREKQQEGLANLIAFTAKLRQCNDDQEMAECAVDALHEAVGTLKHLSAVMMQAALFWKQMQDHCSSLADSEMKSLVESAMKIPEEKRMKVWTSYSFKYKAIQFYSSWVALNSLCLVYMEHIKETQRDLYKCISETPTYEESKRILPALAEKFMADLQSDQRALKLKDKDAEKFMADFQSDQRALKDKDLDSSRILGLTL